MIKPTQITIFGGTGFLGRHIIRRLAKTGAIIRVPTRNPENALPLKPYGDVGQIVPFPCDVRDDAGVAYAVTGSDIVINLIGILFEKGDATFQTVHVETAARIARLAKEANARRLVHVSALGALPGSLSSYSRSKAAGELAVRTFFSEATIFRPSILFGPEDNFFNRFAKMARLSPCLPLIGGGSTKMQPVYVVDIANAVMHAIDDDATRGQTYELAGPQVYSFRELLELILKVTHRKRALINLPWGIAKLQAALFEFLPVPPLTRDQVDSLKSDNIIRNAQAKTLRDLDISPTPVEAILPTYLV